MRKTTKMKPQAAETESEVEFMISLDSGLSSLAEQAWMKAGLPVNCVGAGCGSDEYEFKSRSEMMNAIAVARRAMNDEFDACIVDIDGEIAAAEAHEKKQRGKKNRR